MQWITSWSWFCDIICRNDGVYHIITIILLLRCYVSFPLSLLISPHHTVTQMHCNSNNYCNLLGDIKRRGLWWFVVNDEPTVLLRCTVVPHIIKYCCIRCNNRKTTMDLYDSNCRLLKSFVWFCFQHNIIHFFNSIIRTYCCQYCCTEYFLGETVLYWSWWHGGLKTREKMKHY